MKQKEITRKNLDNKQFSKLRQSTEKIGTYLSRRLSGHLEVLRPLFISRRLLGNYVKSASVEDVPRSDKAFAELLEKYRAVCERPFGLSRKLDPPLPSISNQIVATPLQYPLSIEGSDDRIVTVTSPTRWIFSYRGDCPINRLRAMVSGKEPPQRDEMKQALIDHLVPGIFLKFHPALGQLIEDLRYEIETMELADLGNLPVVLITAPLETFLPPDEFIDQITQLSGIAAFQEIIDLKAVDKIPDSLKESLKSLVKG